MQGSARMGEGGWSSGRIASSSCCQIEFVARQGPPQLIQCSTRHNTSTQTRTHAHIFLISVRAGSTDSWAGPVFLTHSLRHIFLSEGIPLQAKPTGKKKKKEAACVWVKKLRLTARLEGAGRDDVGWCTKAVLYGSVCCTQNSCPLFLWGDKHTILPLFGKTPFFCALN